LPAFIALTPCRDGRSNPAALAGAGEAARVHGMVREFDQHGKKRVNLFGAEKNFGNQA